MLRSDYLPRICAAGRRNDVFTSGRKAFEVGVPRRTSRRCRSSSRWPPSARSLDDPPSLQLEPDLRRWLRHPRLALPLLRRQRHLGGELRLPSNWIADFRRLYDFKEAGRPDLAVPEGKFNRAMRIDTRLAHPLEALPGFPDEENLAFRNLTRARWSGSRPDSRWSPS